jgi:hypothetical protein
MNEPSLIARQRSLLHDLSSFADERSRAEPELAESYRSQKEEADRTFQEGSEALRQRNASEKEVLDSELEQTREAIGSHWTLEQETIQKEYAEARWELGSRLDTEKEAAETAVQEARWAADALLEGAKNDAELRLRKDQSRLAERVEELEGLQSQARALVEQWRQPAGEIEEEAHQKKKPTKGPLPKITDCIKDARDLLEELQDLAAPRYATGKRLPALALLLWLLLAVPLGLLVVRILNWEPAPELIGGVGAGASFIVAVLAWVIAGAVFRSVARRQVHEVYLPLCEVMVDSVATRKQLLIRYQKEQEQALADARVRYARELAKVEARHAKLAELVQTRVWAFEQLEERFQKRRDVSERRRTDELREAEQRHRQGHALVSQRQDRELNKLQTTYQTRLGEIQTSHFQRWQGLLEKWQRLLAAARRDAAEITGECDELYPPWDDPYWEDWKPTPGLPPAMRIGSYMVRTESVVVAEPWREPRAESTPIELTLPALCTFPEPSSILFHAMDEGRDRAVEALQTVMFRLLTSLPAGRVRFTIIDPVGLGQNFAAFMNLADYDEALVGSRIWTETIHIEQRLADLTAHMENVIQKYLRNRYATITEYNLHAGEVAEPYRVLVVANFPTNFSTEACRRLVSIAQSGPRCGVSTLISIDTKQPLPRDFDQADLERCGDNLVWNGGRFLWRDESFGPYSLTLDCLPDDAFCNRVLHQVGEGARDAQRVEVPFEFIAPTPDQWWTQTSRQLISVPLGRAGATRRQHLTLGKGTSQHALVVGKTGSGKSTLLHALITNLALMYSPDEVELYLIDFKKGVEFKTYAVHDLPHARVVAIESEREFGLSVLQRLDAELKLRAERFRAVGAQDLNAYRSAAPEARSPRILLIVDEFQEFFVEDDKLAQEAAQLLDRLVRQGRAFGMHVLLGSQTIGGAYSLARSTIDQMAVRIALQCSEADAHLVLSDDNSAARLLSRPGEAIYNDANGLVEGNDPFQVVWLNEDQREQYLGRVHELVRTRPIKDRPASVVFEGNASADVNKNLRLNRLLARPKSAVNGEDEHLPRVEEAWLGEAMAIDELTAAPFRRQNGSNLLIVGQQAEAALGMLAVGLVSLAAHGPAGGSSLTRLYVIDGHQADAPRAGVLARLPGLVPEPVRLGGWRDLGPILTELNAELERRQKAAVADAPSVYLVLYGLQRMRDLRRQDDDYGFMSRGEEQAATPDKLLATLLREGAALGMHTLIWCDTLNNVQRALDRQTMRELSMRVAFQLSVADSSNLIDSPAASKLGMHRALFSSEEDGRLEKFRPYGVPSDEWLAWVGEQFQQRGGVEQGAEAASGST